jgi:hypothetical protein
VTPHEFSRRLEQIYENNLESVVLYGSAVGTDFSKKFSDYNTIVVLKDCSPGELAKARKLMKNWTCRGNPTPLFFNHEHVQTSRDVFPLEFIDISERHEVLFGGDPFSGISIDHKNLRHQCESELKGKILHLRSFFATEGHRHRRVSNMMVASFSTFTAVFRGILRLLGITPPRENRKVVEELSKQIDFNPTIFMDIINMREGHTALPRYGAASESFENYLTELETITSFVDTFEQRSVT